MECNKDEAIRAMDIAKRKVTENDYSGAKTFAVKAQNLYPQLDGLKQVSVLIDVYISAGNKINGGVEPDWYGVLGVDPSADDGVVKKQYRKLALLLHPDKNKCEGAEGAFKLVSEAWCLLSDKVKRIAFDQKRRVVMMKKEVKPRKSRKQKQEPKEPKQATKKQKQPPKEPKQPVKKQPKQPAKKQKQQAKQQEQPVNRQEPTNQQDQPAKQQKQPAYQQQQQPPKQHEQPSNQQKQPANQQEEPAKQQKQPAYQPEQPTKQQEQQEKPQKQPKQPLPSQQEQPPKQHKQEANEQQQPPKQPKQEANEQQHTSMQPKQGANEQQPPEQPKQPLPPKQPANQQEQRPNQQKQQPSPQKQQPRQPSSKASRNGRVRSNKPTPKVSTFWTVCNVCETQQEYIRVYYLNKNVKCRSCNVSFKATEIEKTKQATEENTREDKDEEVARGIANSDFKVEERARKKLKTDGSSCRGK